MRCRRRASAHPVGRLRPRGSATSARPSRTLYGDEALACGAQRRLLLREAEAHERRTRRRVGIEDGDRDHGHAVLDREPASEVGIGLAREIGRSTRLNSSHVKISYAVFCLKKKKTK